jgi:hypothetical protein
MPGTLRTGRLAVAVASLALLLAARPSSAEDGAFGERRLLDFRLSPGIGAFYYPQVVEGGGFYVGGVGYDLTWYGVQLQLTGEIHAFLPSNPRIGLGLAGAVFAGLAPTGMDRAGAVSVHAGQTAKGGFGGVSGSYWVGGRSRIGVLVGYGATGVGDYYGGSGPTVSVNWSLLRQLGPGGDAIGGLGLRFTFMALTHAGDAVTRGESGGYMTVLVEGALDWAPARQRAAPQ